MPTMPDPSITKGEASRKRFDATVASVLLDAFRGSAALLVCLSHWRYLFFKNYPELTKVQRQLWLIPYALCRLGHVSVIVFFVLSGYLVGGHVIRSLESGRWSWGHYFLQRTVRLYVVLLPALCIGGLLDLTALHYRVAPHLYNGQIRNYLTPDVSTRLGWKTLLGNMLFVQGRFSSTWGSNGALWSLSNEFWYYMLFPSILLALSSTRRPTFRCLMLGTFTLLMFLTGPSYLLGFAVWLLGALLALIPIRPMSLSIRSVALTLYLPIFILSGHNTEVAEFCTVGPLTALLLWVLLGATERASNAPWVHASRLLAGFSYTLYLVHVPLLTIMAGILCRDTQWSPDTFHLLLGSLCFFLTLLLAFLLSTITEARTPSIRLILERSLFGAR